MMRKKRKTSRSTGQIIRRWLITILVLLAFLLILQYIFSQRLTVSGNEMSPALVKGDTVLIDTVSYQLRRPSRYDVVVLMLGDEGSEPSLRRIIALPGETVQINDGSIYVNGVKLDETYGGSSQPASGAAQMPITLNSDEYFVLCDDRSVMSDSRDATVGAVSHSDMLGRAYAVIWPGEHIGLIL